MKTELENDTNIDKKFNEKQSNLKYSLQKLSTQKIKIFVIK